MKSIDTRFSRNVFEAIQKTRSMFYRVQNQSAAPRGFKNTPARFLNIT